MNSVAYTAPLFWAPYLINGDSSGLETDEMQAVDAWIASIGPGAPVDVTDDGFCHTHDAWQFCPLAGDVGTYTFVGK